MFLPHFPKDYILIAYKRLVYVAIPMKSTFLCVGLHFGPR